MTIRRIHRRMLALLVTIGVLTFGLAGPAGAHSVDQSLLYLDVTDRQLGGRVEMPVPAIRTVFGLELEGQGEDLLSELTNSLEDIQAYAADHLLITVDGQELPVSFDGVDLLVEGEADQEANFVQLPFIAAADTGDIPREFVVTFDPFFDEIEDHDGLLLIANDAETGVFENVEEVLLGFDADTRTRAVDLGAANRLQNFTSSIELGVDHIKTGPDHILFVLILLLPSVLVFREIWRPTRTFGAALWRVLKMVTMFTIAHSITFTVAGLDLLPLPPSKLVEAVIAVSIALAALHNIRPIFPNREWVMAFGFGLFHGMGFASLVAGLDVSRSTQLISLLGRNVGIEIGQAAVVLLGFPALFLLRRTRYYLPGFFAVSAVMALVALGWMVERLAEVDLGINGLVEPVLRTPRVFYLAIAATGVAWLIQRFEASRGRLLPVDQDPTGEPARVADPVAI